MHLAKIKKHWSVDFLFFLSSCVGSCALFVTLVSLSCSHRVVGNHPEGGSLQEAKPWSGVYDDFIVVGTSCYLRRFT